MMKNVVATAVHATLNTARPEGLEPSPATSVASLDPGPASAPPGFPAPDPSACWVGSDVAQAHVDVATWPPTERLRVNREEAGLNALTEWRHPRAPRLIVLEATGDLEMSVVAALVAAGRPAAVINPRQARDFAKALGRLAKTDALDAEVLARLGQAIQPAPRPWKDAETQELTALIQRRRQIVERLTAEKNRLASAHPRIKPDLQATIAWLEQRLKDLDGDLPPAPLAGPPGLA